MAVFVAICYASYLPKSQLESDYSEGPIFNISADKAPDDEVEVDYEGIDGKIVLIGIFSSLKNLRSFVNYVTIKKTFQFPFPYHAL